MPSDELPSLTFSVLIFRGKQKKKNFHVALVILIDIIKLQSLLLSFSMPLPVLRNFYCSLQFLLELACIVLHVGSMYHIIMLLIFIAEKGFLRSALCCLSLKVYTNT